jgi:hypothetical protein
MVVEEISVRKRAQEFEDNPELVRGIVAEGADKAREAARQHTHGGQARHAPAGRLKPVKPRPQLKIVVSNEPLPLAVVPQPEQVEMPFAVVNGEPISQMPRDLYIPPQALEVFLEAFEGPLDLLLYLIRRQNLDILDIPLAEITRQYMQYIELMQDLQLELAGEYLVMAATLAEIKSRMLLPRPQLSEEGDLDQRAELVRRLQEYERFKRASPGIDSSSGWNGMSAGLRAPEGAPGGARAAAADAAGDAARLQGRGGALADVRPPPHPARAALGR